MYFSHQFASSVPMFEAGLRMRPDSDLYASGLAAALWHLGRRDAARNAYAQALGRLDALEKKQPLTAEQSCRRALCYARIGDIEMARVTLDGVVRSQPEDQNVLYTSAVLAAMDGRKDAARNLVGDAVRHGYPAGLAKADPDLEEIFQ
jgi:Flp pilus assembly protein TadD